MDSLYGMLGSFGVAYLKGQVVLLPLFCAYFLTTRGGSGVWLRTLLHCILLLFSVLVPAVLLIQVIDVASPLSVTEMMMPAIQVTAMVEENLRRPDFIWVYLVVGCCGGIGLAWLCVDLFRQMLVERRITANATRHRRVGRATVILSSMVASSFTTGFFRPRIYLPPHLADDPVSRGVVLKHEFAHVRRGHLIWAFIEMAYQRLFWFNPLSHFLFHDGRFVRELACDEAAARRCTPVTYAQVLVLQAEWLLSHRGFVLVNPLHESEKTLKRRVTFLLEDKMKKTTLLSIGTIAVSIGVCAGIYFIAGCNDAGKISPLSPTPKGQTSLKNIVGATIDSRRPDSIRSIVCGLTKTELFVRVNEHFFSPISIEKSDLDAILTMNLRAAITMSSYFSQIKKLTIATEPGVSKQMVERVTLVAQKVGFSKFEIAVFKDNGSGNDSANVYQESEVQSHTNTKGDALAGARSRASIMKVVMENLLRLRDVYTNRLQEQPGLDGMITVKFAMNEQGTVIFCEVVKSTVNDATLENAVVEKIKTWQFGSIDKPGDVTEVVYPFTFSQ